MYFSLVKNSKALKYGFGFSLTEESSFFEMSIREATVLGVRSLLFQSQYAGVLCRAVLRTVLRSSRAMTDRSLASREGASKTVHSSRWRRTLFLTSQRLQVLCFLYFHL